MLKSGFRIGRVFGIDIVVDWSWLFIFFLIAWNLGTVFGSLHPEWRTGLTWVIAIVAALLFFLSVLLHELAHALVAKSRGLPVRNITLFLFGGVSNIQREPSTPGDEFIITIVGPITSILIGVILLGAVNASAHLVDTLTGSTNILAGMGPAATIALWLGSVNLLLGIFNLIPGFPLDGGRVLRSILWAITGNLRRATSWASGVGQAVAWIFIIAGIMMLFGASIPFFGTGFINGLWLAFIGWFLNSAAMQSYEQVVIQDVLHGVSVARIMRTNPPIVPSTITTGNLVYDHIMGSDDTAFPVVDDGRLVGMITMADVRPVARTAWDTTLVRDIMTPVDRLVVTTPEEASADALNKLATKDVQQLPVVRGNQLVGLLRRRDLVKWLHLQSGDTRSVLGEQPI